MSHTNLLTHIVFRTKSSVPALELSRCESLYSYIWGVVKNKSCRLVRINGMEDHLHLLVELSANVSVAELVRDIKANSSRWLRISSTFPTFCGWGREYAAFSCSQKEASAVVAYIKNQREHHKKVSFHDEVKRLYDEFGVAEQFPYFWKD